MLYIHVYFTHEISSLRRLILIIKTAIPFPKVGDLQIDSARIN